MKKEIDIMTEEEIAKTIGVSFPELIVLCSDDEGYIRRELLRAVLSFAITQGTAKGRYQSCLNYNTAFRAAESLN